MLALLLQHDQLGQTRLIYKGKLLTEDSKHKPNAMKSGTPIA